MFKRLKRIEARLRCLENDYYDHKNTLHDKRTSRIAERNELAKRIYAEQHYGVKESIMYANEMMIALYGKDWDKNDPIIAEENLEAALASLRKAIVSPTIENINQ